MTRLFFLHYGADDADLPQPFVHNHAEIIVIISRPVGGIKDNCSFRPSDFHQKLCPDDPPHARQFEIMSFHVPEQVSVIRLQDCRHSVAPAEERLDRQKGDALHLRRPMIDEDVPTEFPDLVQIVDARSGKGIVIIEEALAELPAVGVLHPLGTGGDAEPQFSGISVDAQSVVTLRLKTDGLGLSAVHDDALPTVGVAVPDKQHEFAAVVLRQSHTSCASVVLPEKSDSYLLRNCEAALE